MHNLSPQIIKELTHLRHELHRIAELSGEEKRTAEKIKDVLSRCNPDRIVEGIGGEGLAATFKGDGEGPVVMVRCELDALPIPEENDLPYGSETEGVAHKCGHDGHMATVAGVARYLENHRPKKGEVTLLFQPAEETGQGAGRTLNDEKFKQLEPDFIFALHNLPGYAMNQVVLKEDVFASASRGLVVKLKGETSHAAHPENGRSPALALAQLIQSFSAIPQFFTSLDEAAKVTVIHSTLGEIAFGTSPGYAEFRATIRTYDNTLMEKLCDRAKEIVKNTSAVHELEYSAEWTEIFEATVNDKECNRIISDGVEKVNGKADIEVKNTPFAWSEDFGRFTSRYKGAMFGIGAGKDQPQLHSSRYDFPDTLIGTGSAIFLNVIDQIVGLK